MSLPVTQMEIERRKMGLSQWDLARITGIVQSRLSLIERGCVLPKQKEIEAISEALRMSINEVEDLFINEKRHRKEINGD